MAEQIQLIAGVDHGIVQPDRLRLAALDFQNLVARRVAPMDGAGIGHRLRQQVCLSTFVERA
jgi:hypothetical protein